MNRTAIILGAARIGRSLASRLVVTDGLTGEIEHECSVREMLVDNMHDTDVVSDVVGLAPGASVLAGFSIITREAK